MKTAIIITLALAGIIALPMLTNPEAAAVIEVCRESRLITDGDLEQKCAELQDTLGYEFTCDDFGAKANCWAEKK